MKTKEEILEHLSKTGYQHDEIRKIAGYILGAQIVEKGEEVNYHEGDGSFNDFFEWVHEEPKKNVFADIAANLDYLLNCDGRVPESIKQKTAENVQFLMENKEYLQAGMDKKDEAEAFLEDIEEVLVGINKTLESFFK